MSNARAAAYLNDMNGQARERALRERIAHLETENETLRSQLAAAAAAPAVIGPDDPEADKSTVEIKPESIA